MIPQRFGFFFFFCPVIPFLGQSPNLAEVGSRQTFAIGSPLRECNTHHSAATVSKSEGFKMPTTDWASR